ncbi:MAG: OmpA family protein [Alphaproteobacteria bacterium]|nr:OmpA family protein [Alphaproteobacteria bacterium]
MIARRFFSVLVIGLALGAPAGALDLSLPAAARMTAASQSPLDSHSMAVTPWEDGRLELVITKGAVSRQAWVLPATSLTTLQILEPLRTQLEADGYVILFECADVACGGFDFRYALPLLPEPDMHVDLGDYRYLAAERPGDPVTERLSLVVSRSASAGYVHITRVGPGDTTAPIVEAPTEVIAEEPPKPGTLASLLTEAGRAVLEDLVFDRGADALQDNVFPSLIELADYLTRNPEITVVLVGHTDAEGTLENNVALSLRRAQAVADRLIRAYGIPEGQLRAEGVGYLAPRAPNSTEEGRAANRRVEVIKTTTE